VSLIGINLIDNVMVVPNFHHGFASALRNANVVITWLKLRRVLIAVAVIGRNQTQSLIIVTSYQQTFKMKSCCAHFNDFMQCVTVKQNELTLVVSRLW
jgi:hypothetical protein